ncbi:MAG: DNA polymerase Y family protein [Sphingomonadaceae bacterium]|nr:DNA polymerase Y family protein [Sphingomonadaceae bacterium]
MPRLASLFLPDLSTDRIRRIERSAARPDAAAPRADPSVLPARAGSWRPGARWAREAAAQDLVLRRAEGALITFHKQGNQNVLAAACPQARAIGLAPGMPLAKARILVAGLDVRPADPEGDAAWLQRLGLFAARRWTPRAGLSGGHGLWLDLGGVAHLFGGERAMCTRILAFLKRLGFTARIAVASTTGAAHALARFGGKPLLLCPSGREADALAQMPLAALRLDDDLLGRAGRLGLERIGELVAMPRAPLQRRFGDALLLRLDQALGRAAEPFDPIVPEEPPSILLRFVEPIASPEAIAEAAGEAVRRLVPILAEAGLGVRRLILAADRVDREVQRVAVRLARATRDGAHLTRLLHARIEEIEPGFGIERLRLIATRVEPLGAQAIEGELAGVRPAPDLALLIDRLAVRLGTRRVHRLTALESDLPERSVGRAGPLGPVALWPDWPRPVRLLSPPEPLDHVMAELPDAPPARFRWRGRSYRVAAADGPERVYGEWWRREAEREAVRDYFQVEAEDGARFWLFRKGDGEDPATGDLSWHLHGLFA